MPNRNSQASSKMERFVPFWKAKQQNSSEGSSEDKYAQLLIEIEDIINGYIFLRNGSVVKILEVLPLNFTEMSGSVQDRIASTFGYGLKQCPESGHIKIMRSSSNLQPFIAHVRKAMEHETDEQLKRRVEDYLQNTIRLQKMNTKKNRFFFIFEYEGDANGKKSDELENILTAMYQTNLAVTNALQSCGNVVIDYGRTNDDIGLMEILYSFYNPKSSKTESFEDRITKVKAAGTYLTEKSGEKWQIPLADFVAPRGIRFGKWDFLVMDGVYHTYLALKDDSFPSECYSGQLASYLTDPLDDCDLDIFYRQQNRERSLFLLDRTNVISKGVARNFEGDTQKQENLYNSSSNAKYIRDCMTVNDEELYNFCVILTIRANSYKEMKFIEESYLKSMKTNSFYFEPCFLQTNEYFRMVSPYMNFSNGIFKDYSRNMTNSSVAALYCFTSFEMFDPEGSCMGVTVKDSTLFSINNFDTKRFPNPHIFLLGTSGAGKTFTELMLTSRMRMHGIRIVYILPLKGHEYRDAVLSLGGEFISLRPGGEACINIMEIRPEAEADRDSLDTDLIEEYENRPSLLTKKITSIITWLQLLAGSDRITSDEEGELNFLLTDIYRRYGITESNDSIWEDHRGGTLKPMPTITDLYEAVRDNPLLGKRSPLLKTWTVGSCANMNRQTNVDLTKKVIAFDVNEDYIGENLLAAFMYIAFEAGYDICKSNEYEKCAIALDEVWKLLQIPSCAKQVYKMIKILRAYASSAILATQDIEECIGNDFGKAILTNSSIKIFLKVTAEELKTLEESKIEFSEANRNYLMNAPQGRGFVTFSTEKVFVDFVASDYEVELYTTDVNVKRRLRDKRSADN